MQRLSLIFLSLLILYGCNNAGTGKKNKLDGKVSIIEKLGGKRGEDRIFTSRGNLYIRLGHCGDTIDTLLFYEPNGVISAKVTFENEKMKDVFCKYNDTDKGFRLFNGYKGIPCLNFAKDTVVIGDTLKVYMVFLTMKMDSIYKRRVVIGNVDTNTGEILDDSVKYVPMSEDGFATYRCVPKKVGDGMFTGTCHVMFKGSKVYENFPFHTRYYVKAK